MNGFDFLYPDGTPVNSSTSSVSNLSQQISSSSITPTPNVQAGPNFSPFMFEIHDPYYSGANDVASLLGGSYTPTGGTNYNETLSDGQSTVVNVSDTTSNGVTLQNKYTTEVNVKEGTVTSTDTISLNLTLSDNAMGQVLHVIGQAVTAVVQAVETGLSDVASFTESVASSFGGWISNLIANFAGSDVQKADTSVSVGPVTSIHMTPTSTTTSLASNLVTQHTNALNMGG